MNSFFATQDIGEDAGVQMQIRRVRLTLVFPRDVNNFLFFFCPFVSQYLLSGSLDSEDSTFHPIG